MTMINYRSDNDKVYNTDGSWTWRPGSEGEKKAIATRQRRWNGEAEAEEIFDRTHRRKSEADTVASQTYDRTQGQRKQTGQIKPSQKAKSEQPPKTKPAPDKNILTRAYSEYHAAARAFPAARRETYRPAVAPQGFGDVNSNIANGELNVQAAIYGVSNGVSRYNNHMSARHGTSSRSKSIEQNLEEMNRRLKGLI